MSLPAVNMPSTPVMSVTRTSASASALRSAAVMAEYMSMLSAFFFCGRLMRMVWMPSAMSIRM